MAGITVRMQEPKLKGRSEFEEGSTSVMIESEGLISSTCRFWHRKTTAKPRGPRFTGLVKEEAVWSDQVIFLGISPVLVTCSGG